MQNFWNQTEAALCGNDLLKLRVYTSRLLGKEPALVLHGGGNTSVKIQKPNLFGDMESLLYVKGSGWDLATIEAQGFAPVKLDVLLRMAKLEKLSDSDMVSNQKAAMINPSAPAPSVEAILHAIIPFRFVDHTHSDAVVAVTNTPQGLENIKEIYGKKLLIIPYVMPGFILARTVFEMTRDLDWGQFEGMILMHHGIFSFGDDAKTSYDRMIKLVSQAEDFIKQKNAFNQATSRERLPADLVSLAKLRKLVSNEMKAPVLAFLNSSPEALGFANNPKLEKMATQGPLTPDHVIHTKRLPLILEKDVSETGATGDRTSKLESSLRKYADEYKKYFDRNTDGKMICLDPAPRWGVWKGHGILAFGANAKRTNVVSDIARHTIKSIQWSEALGGWTALPEKDIFEVEYWELEQAKLKKGGSSSVPVHQGKVALVTGAASGIGKACAEMLRAQGAAVVCLDINQKVSEIFKGEDSLGICCDVTDSLAVKSAVDKCIERFGGLDIVLTNAGSFPKGQNLSLLDDETWEKTIEINLTSHLYLLRACATYLEIGIDPTIIVMASKNVLAPGPGAAAYSAAKAGLTQLARVAALELGPKGIRVNMLHPHAVFDTGIWTPEVLESRAKNYGMTVEEYKRNNILKVEITSKDIAALVSAMASPLFSKITGAQIAVDGGSDRTI